jgi:hypothetical protein
MWLVVALLWKGTWLLATMSKSFGVCNVAFCMMENYFWTRSFPWSEGDIGNGFVYHKSMVGDKTLVE